MLSGVFTKDEEKISERRKRVYKIFDDNKYAKYNKERIINKRIIEDQEDIMKVNITKCIIAILLIIIGCYTQNLKTVPPQLNPTPKPLIITFILS